jgi:PAS domain S-box-containing protein
VDKVNILLVDDRQENLFALEAMLEDLGENLVKANSGEEALKFLLNQDFAVILLDVQMPKMDGFETAEMIKHREKSQHIPIIFVTAINRSEAHAFKGYSVGAVDYLFKPIVPEILKAKVSTFVELYRKNETLREQAEWIRQTNSKLEHQLEEVRRLNREQKNLNTALQHEIVERRAVEEALKRSEHLYRTLARNIPQAAILLVDHDLRSVLVEGTLFEQAGYDRQSLEGKPLRDVLPPDFVEQWEPNCKDAMAGRSALIEVPFGDATYCVQTLGVRNDTGEVIVGLVLIRDITDAKQAEKILLEANEALEQRVAERTADLKAVNDELSTFTYIVSHDLRSPLLNLKGFTTELGATIESVLFMIAPLLSTLDSDESSALTHKLEVDIPEALKFINAGVTRMDNLTSAVLKLARLGRRELDFEPVDMNQLVETILESLAHQLRQRAASVHVGKLPVVIADRMTMEQIMANLLTNAVVYLSADRPGKIEVTGQSSVNAVTFHVRDNGRGIAPNDVVKVFEPFRRVGHSDVPGEGMGLTYVQALIRRHGGRIWFESELGKGTTFSFTIIQDPQSALVAKR